MTYISYSTAETAKMIKQALKKKFPGYKFSVRSSVYAGGSSIDVSWMDGPTTKEVDAVVKPYQGGGFDGMIDMKYSGSSIMLADGTITYGPTEGTQGSMGSVPAYNPEIPEGAKVVRFGTDHVFTNRKKSPAAYKAGLEAVVAKYGNWIGLPEDLGQIIKVSDWDGQGHLDRAFADKQVTGEPGWNMHWSLEAKVWEAMGEMSFPA